MGYGKLLVSYYVVFYAEYKPNNSFDFFVEKRLVINTCTSAPSKNVIGSDNELKHPISLVSQHNSYIVQLIDSAEIMSSLSS